jgi:hypothetical protein
VTTACLALNPRFDEPTDAQEAGDGSGATATGNGTTGSAGGSGGSTSGTSSGTGGTTGSSSGTGGTTGSSATGGTGATTGPSPEFDCAVDDDALVVCYDFEVFDDGNVIADQSGIGNDLVTQNCTLEAGVIGNGLRMDATSEAIAADAPSLQYNDLRSFELWIRPDVVPAVGPYPARILNKPNSFDISLRPGGALRCGTPRGEATGEVVVVGEWRHIACVDDGTEVSLYVDGTFVDSSVGQMGATNPLGDMYVGNHAIDLDQPFSGTVDNLRVFEDVRTPDEICQAAGTC